jgi:hypothetical protein
MSVRLLPRDNSNGEEPAWERASAATAALAALAEQLNAELDLPLNARWMDL